MDDKQLKYNGRRIILAGLFGSQNYGVDTPESDFDYKIYVIPTKEDIMQKGFIGERIKTDKGINEYYDIRSLPDHLFKTSINFMEVLFSVDLYYTYEAEWFIKNREEIARINLPYLYRTTMGMINSKLSRYVKQGDIKDLVSVLRLNYFLIDYAQFLMCNEKEAFRLALFNRAHELRKARLGETDIDSVKEAVNYTNKKAIMLENFYNKVKPNMDLYSLLKYRVMNIVLHELKRDDDYYFYVG